MVFFGKNHALILLILFRKVILCQMIFLLAVERSPRHINSPAEFTCLTSSSNPHPGQLRISPFSMSAGTSSSASQSGHLALTFWEFEFMGLIIFYSSLYYFLGNNFFINSPANLNIVTYLLQVVLLMFHLVQDTEQAKNNQAKRKTY